MAGNYQRCTRCVMDTTDPEITFDSDGQCNHCHHFDQVTSKRWFPNEEGTRRLGAIVEGIKQQSKGREYDCIMGLSGGVDSSYLALKVKELGLRPLVVHVDAGWNSELAVHNIERLVSHCGFELYTHVVDWEEMRNLQLAFLKSGVANQDVPQDHIFFSTLYHFAIKEGIRYVLSGGNFATESVFPTSWHWNAMDSIHLQGIHRRFGTGKLKQYKTINFFDYYINYPFIRKMKTLRPLNYMPYDKQKAVEVLEETVGYKSYGRKHGESVFTKFFQNHYLPEKFGYDKRLPHLSSMILSGQTTREQALTELEKPLYDPDELRVDKMYFAKKLGLTPEEFEEVMAAPIHSYRDFPSNENYYLLLKRCQKLVEKMLGKDMGHYS